MIAIRLGLTVEGIPSKQLRLHAKPMYIRDWLCFDMF
jgi:hypothetical protein